MKLLFSLLIIFSAELVADLMTLMAWQTAFILGWIFLSNGSISVSLIYSTDSQR